MHKAVGGDGGRNEGKGTLAVSESDWATQNSEIGPERREAHPARPPGWYTDPASQRPGWWDGYQWNPAAGTAPPPPVNQHVTVLAPKSVGVAFLLALLFGPLGLLYASVAGGIIMLIVSVLAAFVSVFTFGVPTFICWVICIVWACVAANGHNSRLARRV